MTKNRAKILRNTINTSNQNIYNFKRKNKKLHMTTLLYYIYVYMEKRIFCFFNLFLFLLLTGKMYKILKYSFVPAEWLKRYFQSYAQLNFNTKFQ